MAHPIGIGYTLELAIWLTGTESQRHLEQWTADAPVLLTSQWPDLHIGLSPLRWATKRPGEDRVPVPPPSISGPDVRLLVVEADVMTVGPKPMERAFVNDLDKRNLARLRAITRRASGRAITDEQADSIIETLGPDSAARALREARALH